jgi:predicted DsbA family dithiol-disulfide isomerase
MKIEIWSDVMCPFCYIGKRHFENAVENLPFKDSLEIEWKSFQLNPAYKNPGNEDLYTFLSASKGISLSQAREMTKQVTDMAANAGLLIDFDHNKPANTFDAHRLIHLAKKYHCQNEIEEKLFEAHFSLSKDIANHAELLSIAGEVGIDVEEAQQVLNSDAYADEVRKDINESKQLGIRGVPFFVIDRKYGISGAQPSKVFMDALNKGFDEWKTAQ